MSSSSLMALPSPIGSLAQYLQVVESFPCLDKDEERALAIRVRRDDDLDAAKQLILSHLRYVVYIARGYAGYGLPQEDLIQEGNVGLMKAVRRFDPGRGIRLAVYASYWIRAHIHEFILRNWRLVRVVTTKAARKLFFKLRSAKQRLEWLKQDEADEIADTLNVTAADVFDMEGKLYISDESLDSTPGSPDDEDPQPARDVQDGSALPDSEVIEGDFFDVASDALADALVELDPRSRDIIRSRWLVEDDEKLTLQALGERYHVSAERIRQLETAAIRKLRETMLPRLGVDRCDVGVLRNQSLIAA